MLVADFSCGAAWTWVNAATMQGALATGGDRRPLEAEMSADFLVSDMMHPECIPNHDFEWELVRYYNRSQLDAVVIVGRPCVENEKPVGWDAKELWSNRA